MNYEHTKILHHTKVDFAVLGTEESCTGDPAKRAGNEFVFQMQAMSNIEVLNSYEVIFFGRYLLPLATLKIVT